MTYRYHLLLRSWRSINKYQESKQVSNLKSVFLFILFFFTDVAIYKMNVIEILALLCHVGRTTTIITTATQNLNSNLVQE